MSTTANSPKSLRAIVICLFLLSGFAGLVYQVVWLRMLMVIFGVTAYAISTVLASFMAGLAIGSYLFGRWIDRHPGPLRAYGWMEIAIGGYGLLVPLLFRLDDRVFSAIYPAVQGQPLAQNAVRFVLSFAVLVVPTILMGATLPILAKYFVETLDRVGKETGRLYFINTLGAVLGCVTTGFLLIPTLGLLGSTAVAAFLNVTVGVAALVLHRRAPGTDVTVVARATVVPEATGERKSREQRGVLIGFALSGFIALVFEVIWSRILILVFGSTVYSFSAMLTVFLLGLAIGGALFGWIVDRVRNPYRLFCGLLATISIVILAETAAINHLPYLFLDLLGRADLTFTTLTTIKFVLSFLVLFPATVLFGGTFPVVSKLYTDRLNETGSSIGTAYAMNTVGAIAGSIVGGFILLPFVGMRGSLLTVATLLLLGSSVLFLLGRGSYQARLLPAMTAVVVFGLSAAVLPAWNRDLLALGVYFEPRQYLAADGSHNLDRVLRETRTLYYAEGLNDTIIVNETATERVLTVNGKTVASSSWEDILVLKMLGHLPYLVHPGFPETSINVGLGIGGTISGLAAQELDRVEVAELERAVPPATRMFADTNDRVLDNPKVHIVLGDGRDYLRHTENRYDIISSDPFHPYMTGAGNLYSREYLEIGKSRLKPGGVMTQWIPIYQLGDREFRSLIRTFADVFPYYSVWFSGRSVILVGSEQPMVLDADVLRKKMDEPNAREWLRRLGMDTPEKLLSFLLADQDSLVGYHDDVSPNTDMNPHVEYRAARQVYESTTGTNLARLTSHLISPDRVMTYLGSGTVDHARTRELILARHDGVKAIADFYAGDYVDANRRLRSAVASSSDPYLLDWLSFTHEKLGQLAQSAGDSAAAIENFETALAIRPDSITSATNLGYLYYFEGRYEEASTLLDQALRAQPSNSEVMLRLAMVRDAIGDPAMAENLYRMAIETAPESALGHALLGTHLYSQGRFEEARARYMDSLAIEPQNQTVLANLAEVEIRLGRSQEAVATVARLLERNPTSRDGNVLAARVAAESGDWATARARLNSALEVAPQDPWIHFEMAKVLVEMGEPDSATRALSAAANLGGAEFLARAAADPRLAALVETIPAPEAPPAR